MERLNGGQVERAQRLGQVFSQRRTRVGVCRQPPSEDPGLIVVGDGASVGNRLGRRQRTPQRSEQAFAQFGRGRLSEGAHEDLVHTEAPFDEQPQPEQGDGISFSGAGTGLNGRGSGQGLRQGIELGGFAHAEVRFSVARHDSVSAIRRQAKGVPGCGSHSGRPSGAHS